MEPEIARLKKKYRDGREYKSVSFKPKFERLDRRRSKHYQKFCKEHPKSKA